MIGFANPAAWWCALALGVPIAVHLVRRHRARRQPFPTLQFLPASRVAAVRIDRPTDLGLLATRLAIIAGAVAALAQPVAQTGVSSGPTAPSLARAVLVDARLGSGADAVVRERNRLTPAAAQVEIEAKDLRAGVDQAAGWIARQHGTREVVVISDFPVDGFSRDIAAALPAAVGLRLIAVDRPRDTSPESGAPSIEWLAASSDRAEMEAAIAAAASAGGRISSGGHPITVVFPGAPGAETLVRRATPLAHDWMYDVVDALRANSLLRSAARDVTVMRGPSSVGLTPLVANAAGAGILAAAEEDRRLLLFCLAAAGSFVTSALARAIGDATRRDPETDSTPIDRTLLASWERVATPTAPTAPAAVGRPMGRWVWLGVLVLLLLESWWRRDRSVVPSMETRRVA